MATEFEQDLENVLGEYILGFEDEAKGHLSEALREHQNFDMESMTDEGKDFFFFEKIDRHSLDKYERVFDGYSSLKKDRIGTSRKNMIGDFARNKAISEDKKPKPEEIKPESFTSERNLQTQYNFLEMLLEEKFIEEYGSEKLEGFRKAVSSYNKSVNIVDDAKNSIRSGENFGKTLEVLYRDITSKMESYGKPPETEYDVPESEKDVFEKGEEYVGKKKEKVKEVIDEGVKKAKETLKEADEILDEKKKEFKDVIDTTAEEIEEDIGYVAEKWEKIRNYVKERTEAFKGHWKENKKKYLVGAGGLATVGVAAWLFTQIACPLKKHKEVPKTPPPKVEKARPQEKAVYQVKPSESLLSEDIGWVWEQDSSKWDVLPAAENSKMGDYIGNNYTNYTDISLNGNVVSLTHGDALNKGEEVEYIGVKIGKEGKWIYLKSGSRFDMEVAPEEAEILRNGGELEYQVVGLGKGKNGKHVVKASYKNAKLNLSREAYRELLRQELMGGLEDNSVKKNTSADMGACSLFDREDFRNAFQNYIDKRSDNGEDVSLLDNTLADFTGSIAEMYNDGVAPWKIGRQTGMSTQDVYSAISASREFGNVIKPTRYNSRLFSEIFHTNYA